ncbi:hypothetical protein WJX73_003808 [Symbiochloris irregularis]|uniref:HMA domain-containing protein n=1 Tax=Symbiochloris irregularis TaxID=706552 RepID=A0AAW1P9E9_9CHLO
MSQETHLKVAMACGGCEGAVKRILSKQEGVQDFKIDLAAQKVTVKSSLSPQQLVDIVSKSGKKTELWS